MLAEGQSMLGIINYNSLVQPASAQPFIWVGTMQYFIFIHNQKALAESTSA